MAGFDWLRLWHDMPNDPKWRTIARASGQPISLVVSTYLHILVDASQGVTLCHDMSRTVTRGVTDVTNEDIASALDCPEDAIQAIREAMQGRVLDGQVLLGWDKRQPKREDSGNPETGVKSSAQRKREQRERERQDHMSRDVTQSHEASRDVTLDKDKEEDKEEDKEKQKPARKRAVSLPATFGISQRVKDWAKEKGFGQLEAHLENFLGYAKSSGKTYADWDEAFMNAIRNNWAKLPAHQGSSAPNRWAGLR